MIETNLGGFRSSQDLALFDNVFGPRVARDVSQRQHESHNLHYSHTCRGIPTTITTFSRTAEIPQNRMKADFSFAIQNQSL
jgi:hypothetical protein